jgi:hypothetical protein
MSVSKTPVKPRAYELNNTPLPFARGTYYRWEKQGIIPPLLRIGGKTLLPDETVEDILSGKIVPPSNHGRINPPQPRNRAGRPKPPKPPYRPKPSAAAE